MKRHSYLLRRGLTLVELMMVIVIIGILAGVVAVSLSGTDDKARVTVAETNIKSIRDAIDQYMTMYSGGYLPESLQELVDGPPDYDGVWRPLFREGVPKDPWGNDFVYEVTNDATGEYQLTCYGKDGEPGGEEYAADIIWPDPDGDTAE